MAKERQFRPMLAPSDAIEDPGALKFPVLVSPKYDGIRCVIRDGKALSRSLKPIPNRRIRTTLEALGPAARDFDGEIMLPYPATFHAVSSAVMSQEAEPPADWFFVVFDRVPKLAGEGFASRIAHAGAIIAKHKSSRGWRHVRFCEHAWIETAEQLAEYEAKAVADGHEGAMIRDPAGPYKFGRATTREGYLYKLKRFADGEAVIVGVLEQHRNDNPAFVGELGQTKRRKLKANLVPAGVMGKLVVRDLKTGVEFRIGTGFTAEQCALFWRIRDTLPGRIVRYRSQEHGVKDKPRIASFDGFRARADMD